MSGPSKQREDLIRTTASSFCQALLDPPSPAELISKYFTSVNPCITEHGPEWARSRLPFLAKTFTGQAGCEEYFTTLSQTLKMQMGKDTFPAPNSDGYVTDANATAADIQGGNREGKPSGVVCVVGEATFASLKTGKQWHEKFIYRFSLFDEDGRIGHWEIWADPLSAWVAVGGE
jgi:hypothetical protein